MSRRSRLRRNAYVPTKRDASDPNTSPDRLLHCAHEFPEETLSNPALAMMSFEAPATWTEIHKDAWAALIDRAFLRILGQTRAAGETPFPKSNLPKVFAAWANEDTRVAMGAVDLRDLRRLLKAGPYDDESVEEMMDGANESHPRYTPLSAMSWISGGHASLFGQRAAAAGEDHSWGYLVARKRSTDALARILDVTIPWPEAALRPNRRRR